MVGMVVCPGRDGRNTDRQDRLSSSASAKRAVADHAGYTLVRPDILLSDLMGFARPDVGMSAT